MTDVFDYVMKNGQCNQQQYRYTGRDGKCRGSSCNSVTTVSSRFHVTQGNNEAMMAAVSHEPIAVAVAAGIDFMFYGSGILTCSSATPLNHGVLLVGYV